MAFKFYKVFEHDNIADGTTVSGSWTADENYLIKRVHIINKAGAPLNKSTIYFKIGDRVFTREIAPALVFGQNVQVTAVLDIPFGKGEKLDYTFKNNEGSAVSIFIALEVHTP